MGKFHVRIFEANYDEAALISSSVNAMAQEDGRKYEPPILLETPAASKCDLCDFTS